MRGYLVWAAALALVSCGKAPHGGKIAWRDGGQLQAALDEAGSSGTPLMLYFTASW